MHIEETEKDHATADRSALLHPRCEQCKQECCALDDDGVPHCQHDCEADFGHPVYNIERDVVGYVHKDCMKQYVLDGLVVEIEQSLKVRAPLGLEPWIVDRARNLASRLAVSFDIKLLSKE